MAENRIIENIRNIGIIAHIDAGKTTVTERILYYTGTIHKTGETHNGQSQMDWMDQERERGITITSAATTACWKNHYITIIDTPGHVDFTAEVVRSLRILDGAVTVLDAQSGVEPQTMSVWRQATNYQVPRLVFVNKMDKIGADFAYSLDAARTRLRANAHPIQIPMGEADAFSGVIDLIRMQAVYYGDSADDCEMIRDIPSEYADVALEWRSRLIEAVAEFDEPLMGLYLEGKPVTEAILRRAIRAATVCAAFFPVLCGSALKNKGIPPLLDAIADYLPSPLDIPSAHGIDPQTEQLEIRKANVSEPFSALVFKVMADPNFGRLTYFRVYSGQLRSGDEVYNSGKQRLERIGRIMRIHANSRTAVAMVQAGDIVAYVANRDTGTGDSLCDEKHPIAYESIKFPMPVIQVVVIPKNQQEGEKLIRVLRRVVDEDPTIHVGTHAETGKTILSGMGELHIDITVERIRREFGVELTVGAMQVAYRETFQKKAQARGRYIRQSGGKGQYGDVIIMFTPLPRESGFVFENAVNAAVIPPQFIPAIESGLRAAMERGVAYGYPIVDIKATLVGGSAHPVDSSKIAFSIASSMALQEAAKGAEPILLEPVMQVEIVSPLEYVGEVLRQIASRRGRVVDTRYRGEDQAISAHVPFSEIIGYATDLRSATKGQGTFTMEYLQYQQAPHQFVRDMHV